MNAKNILFAAAVLAVLPVISDAKNMTADEIVAKMEEADNSINAIEFDFRQEVVYNLTNEKQSNNGKVSFVKPDNIHIRQFTPLEQEITANGKKVWIYTPKYRQVIVDSWKKWSADSFVPVSIINFGKGFKDLKKKYLITCEGMDDNKYVLLFKPVNNDSFNMKFWVESESFIPVKLMISGDNITIMTEMLNKRINSKIDKKIYSFKAPAGVEVMDLP